jgi:glutamate-1-semialdehyde 2,1-aminomutase
MEQLAPLGPVYQAGTLSGNPVAMAAGLVTLKIVSAPGFYDALESKTQRLTAGLKTIASDAGTSLTTNAVGGMFGLFFTAEPTVSHYAQAIACDIERFKAFFHGLLSAGVYLAPSAFEAGFISSAHTEADIAETLAAAERAFARL